ncbi:MAG: Lrp/AsnC family transcriptional regulator [Alistipes sp.]|nr:Lrp/AsnC family transcriptional regulator [Alistipes sp.]
MTTETTDAVDLAIMRELQRDGRLTTRQLAMRVHRSPTAVFERVKRLENEGFIRRYTAVLDAEKLGQGFLVYCQVKLRFMNNAIAEDFVSRVAAIPEVTECYNVSGAFDYLLRIHARSMEAYREFLLNKLGTIESLGSVESTFVMSQIKHDYSIPL